MSAPATDTDAEKRDLELKNHPDALDTTIGLSRDEVAETLKVEEWGYDIVKALVSADDDPTERAFTFRFWFLGTLLGIFAGALRQLYTFKPQNAAVSPLMLSVFGYVGGIFLSKVLPTGILNPGAFTKKELALIVICASTGGKGVSSTLFIGAKNLYFNQKYSYFDAIIFVLTTQFIGYGLPTPRLLPAALAGVSLFETLFAANLNDKACKLFWISTAGLFCWTFMPQYMAPTLIGISVFCLANQNSPLFTQLLGGVNSNEGLGIGSISLDWNNIGDNGLVLPWVTQVNQIAGMIGSFNHSHLVLQRCLEGKVVPIHGPRSLYLATGKKYNQTKILTNDALDEAKYAACGQPYYSTSWAFNTMMQNMSDIIAGMKAVFNKKSDGTIQEGELAEVDDSYRLPSVHPEVPLWWYGALMALSIALGFYICVKDDSLPWWAFILTVFIALIFAIVSGLLTALTGFSPPFKTFLQLIGGFLLPGRPIANMYFTTFGGNTILEAVAMRTDLKIGQYMKIAPRAVFFAQMYGGFIGALIHWVLNHIILDTKRDMLLDPNGDIDWSGQNIIGFNTKAITFGTLAPKLLAAGGTSEWLSYAFIVDAFLPIPFWLGHKYFPKVGFSYINTTILTWNFCLFAVGVNCGWFSRIALGFLFQLYLRK
ncbi:OPT oligopeptide transporter protein-domain-containing protein [Chytriomyces cf. hyalinus JEL632]|nr:OPT oligopeptide transporter protein-domain-containing protein [Chytriomyces cf. hyalinus JEL632]